MYTEISSFHFQIIALQNLHFEFVPSMSQFWPVLRRMTHIYIYASEPEVKTGLRKLRTIESCLRTMESCISDVKVWVVQWHTFQLNDDKTEIRLSESAPRIDFLLHYVWVRMTSHFPMQLLTLASFLSASLHWRNRLNKLCQLAYLEIRRIASIRQYLSSEATKTRFLSCSLQAWLL